MRRCSFLPEPPLFHIEVVRQREAEPFPYLRHVSRDVRTVDPAGRTSRVFRYDEVDRVALDAVVIVPHFLEKLEGRTTRYVVFRSAIRPPVALREERRSPMVEPENRGLWEFPAGLVEEAEQSAEGLRRAAVRELLEETGFAAPAEKLTGLGPSSFPSPGVIGERHFYFQVEVDPREQREPELDGSPLEAAGELIAVPLSVALAACRKGDLADAKSEIALRRLVEQLTLNGETT